MNIRPRLIPISAALLLLVLAPPERASYGQSQTRAISVGVGEFRVVTLEDNITRIAVDKPQIADYTVTSKREILVNGNRVGRTTMKITLGANVITYTVDVIDPRQGTAAAKPGDGPINESVQKILRNPNILVTRTDRGVVISGHVGTDAEKDRAEKVVRAYMSSPQEDVTNVLEIRKKPQQVKMKIRVMNITDNATRTYGIDWGTFSYTGVTQVVNPSISRYHDEFILSGTKSASSFPRMVFPLRRSDMFTAVDPFMLQIRALIDSGIIQLLSAPDVVAQSGAKTDIVIGGQIPIPSSTSSGGTTQTAIEWRDYGIKVSVEPNIVDQNRVTAKIYVEVSSLDKANGVTIGGGLVPAVLITQAMSEINVETGKTVFLSGLKQEKNTRNVSGIPGLSQLPLLGVLFGTHTKGLEKSDLVISVSADIIDDGSGK